MIAKNHVALARLNVFLATHSEPNTADFQDDPGINLGAMEGCIPPLSHQGGNHNRKNRIRVSSMAQNRIQAAFSTRSM